MFKKKGISTAHGRGLGACPEFPEKLRGVMGAVPPNAARRRIATTRRGYTFLILSSMKLPLIVGVLVGVVVGVAVGVAIYVAVSHYVHQAEGTPSRIGSEIDSDQISL